MSRRGDVYEERDYYSREEVRAPPVRVRERDYEETDVFTRRSERGSRPDFLREDFGRGEAGPLVIRERDTEIINRPERRPRSPSPVRIRERIIERSPPRQEEERIRTRVVERERREPSPPPPERLRARVIETRERIRERSPSPVRIRERIVERERERERTPSPPQVERVRIRNIEREIRQPSPEPSPSPSPPPPPAIRAPPIHQEIITHHRHIDHGFERARVPTPPPPPRRSEPRTKETDIDIYTSRNNTEVDITRKESRGPTPKPQLRRGDTFYDDSIIYEQERDKLRVRDTRLDINRRRSLSARPERREKESVHIDIRESGRGETNREVIREVSRGIGRDEEEAAYYERKVNERAYIGEAYNGATKDWAIVDVPPGTERVQMEGVGGASQEITWQKYNGVRRSKFNPERERERERVEEKVEIRENTRPRESSTSLEIDISRGPRQERGPVYEREYERIEETSDRRVGFPRAPPKQRMGDLWTEITKDLVAREAIEELGYDYEETEFFFYVLQYLRYEDVLELVQVSESIRRERKQRLREIEYERERMERWERKEKRRERERDDYTDERIIEREVIYDGRPPRRGGW
ncbi:uncharacterized protein LY89DRAFT_337904 [Mollisia scopiformis]|uniref:DUF8035 domain-containing protein n=1 Tax=Mollisia scopiformis TaxID=149040 RepID=A0A132B717_MOLSC|nr:uncharacterized protein LY89DRAFT_337904 [Mollisia scopiformis]KUJ08205.1 hypothetical protein LY89DRAFT_337904 [Mollisia scopiformis]